MIFQLGEGEVTGLGKKSHHQDAAAEEVSMVFTFQGDGD
jgi:hypothetical protein